jgi:hypothetical protein
MSTVLSRLWLRAHALPWVLAEVAVRYALTSLLVGLYIWHFADRTLVYAALAGLTFLAVGPDALTRASSLLFSIKLSYRLAVLRMAWSSAMQRAKLYETTHIEDSLHSLRSIPGGRKVPKLKRWGRNRIRRTPCGIALTVDGSKIGAGVDAFQGEQATVLRAKWKALDLIVDSPPGRPYLTRLRVILRDPFASVIRPSHLPPPPLPPTGVCYVGKDSDGNPLAKDARLPNLIAGAPGAGKSSECWMFLWALLKQGLRFRTRVYDPKGGQEFFDLADKAYRYCADATGWCKFLEEALSAMAAQQAALKAAGHRKWKPELASQFPLDIMIIDELVTVIAMMAGSENKVTINGKKVPALKAFLVYLSQCRAAGFTVLACTQLTQKEAIGLIRDLFAYVTCLRVGSDEMVKTVLGDSKLYPAHQIPVGDTYAGIGFMSTDRGPVKYRAAYLEDSERAEIAIAIGELTRGLLAEVKHDHVPGMPIHLDLGDTDLEVTEEEQAVLDELVHICVSCQREYEAKTGEPVLNGAAA